MAIYVDTNKCERRDLPNGQGAVAEVMNKPLCGAENGAAMLRWLKDGDCLRAEAQATGHQLIYVMEGAAIIDLDGKDYDVARGGGIYLGCGESASIRPDGDGAVKLFHLVVPESRN